MSGSGDSSPNPPYIPDDTEIEENETSGSSVQWNPGGGSSGGSSGGSTPESPSEEYNVTIEKLVRWPQPWTDCVYGRGPFVDEVELPRAGLDVTFLLSIENNEEESVDVNVTDHLPEGIIYRGFASIPCIPFANKANRNITWVLEDIGPGEKVNITFLARVRESGTHVNLAEVSIDGEIIDQDTATVVVNGEKTSFFDLDTGNNVIYVH
jgi:hypothetical protein